MVSTTEHIEVPPLASTVFGTRLALAQRYGHWLATVGVERGLVGPREVPRLWDRHLLNSVTVAAVTPADSTVVDLGSGAGLPGLVLAIARPDLRVILVESMLRRINFLQEVVADLGVPRVEVRRARAEELRDAEVRADVVTARAVAPIDRLAGWAGPLLAAGGQLLALKGERVTAELANGWVALRRAGFVPPVEAVSVWDIGAAGGQGTEPGREPGCEQSMLPGLGYRIDESWSDAPPATVAESSVDRTEPLGRIGRMLRVHRRP